jgi:hypothetical protein
MSLAPLDCLKISLCTLILWFSKDHLEFQVALNNQANAQLISQCPRVLGAGNEIVLYCLLSSAAAAEMGKHRGDTSLEEKSIQAINSCSMLDS